MQYKIYTLQHQKLYDQIHAIDGNSEVQKIVNKETLYLLDKCKEIRRDFSILSKVREFDALFSDILIRNNKKTYSFEHVIVYANTIYVLERKKSYDNQKQLLKEKTNYLKKCIGKNVNAEFYILMDAKTTKPNYTTLDMFIENCLQKTPVDGVLADKVDLFIQNNHIVLDISTYIKKKYNVDIKYTYKPRASRWVTLSKFTNPLVSKYKGTLSFLSSVIIFFYLLCVIFTYSIYAKDKQFLLTLGVDAVMLFLLINVLKEIESKCPKWLRLTTLMATLTGFIGLFWRILIYI